MRDVPVVRPPLYALSVALLASFVKFKVDFSAGSGDYSPAENAQFVEKRTIAPTNPLGYYSQHVWQFKKDASTYSDREKSMFGIHWVNLTSGEIDTTWTSADYAAVESAVETFWTAQAARLHGDARLVEHRWYAYGASVAPPNPPSRVTTLGTPISASGTSSGPHQNALTVTLRTTLRRHWGRIYLPLRGPLAAVGGQLASTDVDPLAADARTMLMVTPSAQGVIPVVYDRARKIAAGVTSVEVDSVPDVVRRRRPRDTAYKKIYTS